MLDKKHIKKKYVDKSVSDIVNVPSPFLKELNSYLLESLFIKDKEVQFSIITLRIIFKILNDISNDQAMIGNVNQIKKLNSFNENFLIENNSSAFFSYKYDELRISKNIDNLRESLDFLWKFKSGINKIRNSRGKIVSFSGGFITSWAVGEGRVEFTMSAYWLEKLLIFKEKNSFNPMLYSLMKDNLKMRKAALIFWVFRLKNEGTLVNWENMQLKFNYNFEDKKDFIKSVLKPLKKHLDENSNRSFNYSSIRGSNNIKIVPYKNVPAVENLKKGTITKLKITQRLAYWKRYYRLSKDTIDRFKYFIAIDKYHFIILNENYKFFLKAVKKKKGTAANIDELKFLELLNWAIFKNKNNSKLFNLPNSHLDVFEGTEIIEGKVVNTALFKERIKQRIK